MSGDPYAALGLARSATAAEIKKAYRKIARTSHPDLNPDDPAAEARLKAASHAYDLLKDPDSRARFDRGEPRRVCRRLQLLSKVEHEQDDEQVCA